MERLQYFELRRAYTAVDEREVVCEKKKKQGTARDVWRSHLEVRTIHWLPARDLYFLLQFPLAAGGFYTHVDPKLSFHPVNQPNGI